MIIDPLVARKIRPGLLVWFSLFFSVLALTDGNYGTFTVKVVYVKVLESILVTMYAAYFLGKSGERIVDMKTKSEKKEEG